VADRNAEEIEKRAGLLYDKVAGFVTSMEGVGTRLCQAPDSYDTALRQLSQGSGNLLRQSEMLKALGARTTKSIGVESEDGGYSVTSGALPSTPAIEAAEWRWCLLAIELSASIDSTICYPWNERLLAAYKDSATDFRKLYWVKFENFPGAESGGVF